MKWPWQKGRMRDGSKPTDPRLGRVAEFDDKSRAYPVTAHPRFQPILRGRSWWCPHPYLDQGQTPECVAFAGGNRLRATPIQQKNVTQNLCHQLYFEAQQNDEWAGSNYDGTSGLGLAKTLKLWGYIDSYYWCFSAEQIMQAVASTGPVLVGWPWYESMFDTRTDGLLTVDPASGLAGGHEVMLRGLILKPRLGGVSELGRVSEPVFRGVNNWSEGWGLNGEFFVRLSDVEKLMKDQGDALVVHEVRP